MESEEFTILHRRKVAAERYLRGESQWQIARALEVTQATISTDLKAMREQWLAQAKMDTAERQAEELAKFDALERVYWSAWERSCLPRKSKAKRSRDAGGTDTLLREEKRDGSVAFLKGVERCIIRRCEILGILERAGVSLATVVTVVAGIDLDVITGLKPGIPYDRLREATGN